MIVTNTLIDLFMPLNVVGSAERLTSDDILTDKRTGEGGCTPEKKHVAAAVSF